MRHTNIKLLLSLLLIVVGCSKMDIDNRDTYLTNIATSDCLFSTDTEAAKDLAPDSIVVTLTDWTLSVTHSNMLLDCGSGENIVTTMELVGDTIKVTENVGEQGITDCICLYNNSFQIRNLPPSPFTLVIQEMSSYFDNIQRRIVYQHTF